jgi:hypothetical protein
MARPLEEYFSPGVIASDCQDYGWGHLVHDFLFPTPVEWSVDWIITNPPFKLAEQFVSRGLEIARDGVAVLVRSAWLEGCARYGDIFKVNRPSLILQYAERVPMVEGRVDEKASSATAYCWVVWEKPGAGITTFDWIAPCRKAFERAGDYREAAA